MYAKDVTQREIARTTSLSERTVQRRLKRLPKIWPNIRDFILEIEKDESIKTLLRGEKIAEKPLVKWMRKRFENRYHLGPAPYGYRKDSVGELVQVPEEAKFVEQIFIGFENGKTTTQLAKENALSVHQVYVILHSPVYKGWVCFGEDCRPGRHKPIVSEKLWDRCQRKPDRPWGLRQPLWGYKYEKGLLVIDREKDIGKIEKMSKLRIARKSLDEIAHLLQWSKSNVKQRLKNPSYAGLKWMNGKLVPGNHPAIVNPELWKAANAVQIDRLQASALKRKTLAAENRGKIFAMVKSKGEATVLEIAKEFRLNRCCVANHLRGLEADGIVERIPPQEKRKGRGPLSYKWRIKTG